MTRREAVTQILVWLLSIWVGICLGQRAGHNQQHPETDRRNTERNAIPYDAPMIVGSRPSAAPEKPPDNATQARATTKDRPCWCFFMDSNWALFLAAVATFFAVWHQARSTADAVRLSAEALDTSNRAILRLGNWNQNGDVVLMNIGAAPARILAVVAFYGAVGSEVGTFSESYDVIVLPNGQLPITNISSIAPVIGTRVVGRIDYEDRRNGVQWMTFKGHFQPSQNSYQLMLLGGEAHSFWLPDISTTHGRHGRDTLPPPVNRVVFSHEAKD